MKLVLAVDRFPAPSQTFIVAKVLALLGRGLDVHVVCRVSEPGDWDAHGSLRGRDDVRARVHVTRIGRDVRKAAAAVGRLAALREHGVPRAAEYARDAARSVGWRKAVHRIVTESWFVALRPDLVHFEFGSQAVPHMHLKRLLGCPFTVSFRGFDLNYVGLDDPHFYDEVWAGVDGVHCLGEDLWRRALARGCPPDVLRALIPPAVDASRFSPPARGAESVGVPGRPLRLLSVGRLHWKKGHDHALAAVRILLDQGLTVEHRIVGDGPGEEEVRAAAAALGVDHVVRLLGHIPHEQVRDELAWADVLVHASVSEGFANAVLEAQAMAVPVVCSDADGLPDNVVDGETGFVVARRDPAAMAARLAALAGDGERRRAVGEAGRERALHHFRPEKQVDDFVAFFEAVLTRASARGPRDTPGTAGRTRR